MPLPNTYWFYNQGTADAAKTGGSAEDENFKAITVGTAAAGHTLVFTGPAVVDGDPTGTRDTIIIPASGEKEIDKTFIDNNSIVDQVMMAGTNQGGQSGGNTRYVFCIYFDGETASEPYLEFWDDVNHNSYGLPVLGAGEPSNSMVKGVATTDSAPGSADWVAAGQGSALAGSGNANRLKLSGAAIGSAGDYLYFNLCVRVPSSASPFSNAPLATLRFTYT